jgi:hypothetical protein
MNAFLQKDVSKTLIYSLLTPSCFLLSKTILYDIGPVIFSIINSADCLISTSLSKRFIRFESI